MVCAGAFDCQFPKQLCCFFCSTLECKGHIPTNFYQPLYVALDARWPINLLLLSLICLCMPIHKVLKHSDAAATVCIAAHLVHDLLQSILVSVCLEVSHTITKHMPVSQ